MTRIRWDFGTFHGQDNICKTSKLGPNENEWLGHPRCVACQRVVGLEIQTTRNFGIRITHFWLVKDDHFRVQSKEFNSAEGAHQCLGNTYVGRLEADFLLTLLKKTSENMNDPSSTRVWDTIMVVKIMAMQTTWIGGKSVAKTTGKLIKGPRTSSGTPNHQLSNRNRKTKKRTAATRWSCLWALHFGTYQVAVQSPTFSPDSSKPEI